MRVMVQAQAQTKAQLQHVTMLLQDLVLRMQEVEPLLEAQTKAQLQHVKRTALLEAQTQAQCHAGASMLSAQNDVVAGPNAARDEASHNSFATNDGIRPPTTASGSRMTSLPEVLPGTETVHQALPVHVPARSREAGVEAAGQGAASGAQEVAEADDRIADLIRLCLETHGGQFDPSRISSKASGQQPGERLLGGSTPGLGGSTTGSTADRSSPIAIAQIGGMALTTVAGHNVVGVRGLDVEALRRQFEPTPSPLSTPSHTNEG